MRFHLISWNNSLLKTLNNTIDKSKPLSDKESEVSKFDFETKTVLLNSGYTMPIMGLGIKRRML